MFREVRDAVLNATNGTQEPFISTSLPSQAVYLVQPQIQLDAGATSHSPPPVLSVPVDSVRADFQYAKDVGTKEAWDAFITQHGALAGNFYVSLAKIAREKLEIASPPPKITDQIPESDRESIAHALQRELKRVSCYNGRIDGLWGKSSQNALRAFNAQAGTSFNINTPSEEALLNIQRHEPAFCGLVCSTGERVESGKCIVHVKPTQSTKTRPTKSIVKKPANSQKSIGVVSKGRDRCLAQCQSHYRSANRSCINSTPPNTNARAKCIFGKNFDKVSACIEACPWP